MSVSQEVIDEIDKSLEKTNYDLINEAYSGDHESINILNDVIVSEFGEDLKTPEDVLFVQQEITGLGIIDRILQEYPKVTDIGYDGEKLIIQSNDGYQKINDPLLNDEYVNRLLSKIATRVDLDFTQKESKLSGVIGNLRIQAMNEILSTAGPTFSIRVAQDDLVLTEDNWSDFADPFMLKFWKLAMKGHFNTLLSGGMGYGKTSFQKLLLSFCNPGEKIIITQDQGEMNAKKLLPWLYLYEWIARAGVSFSDLTVEAFRNNAVWVMPAEVRGIEVGSMMEGVVAGTNVLTTLHAYNAPAIPRRVALMVLKYLHLNEQSLLEDIYNYFHFGGQLKRIVLNGKVNRFLDEVVEFRPDLTVRTIYKRIRQGSTFTCRKGKLSQEVRERMMDFECDVPWLEEVFGFVPENMDA